jgi:hypothetical protein
MQPSSEVVLQARGHAVDPALSLRTELSHTDGTSVLGPGEAVRQLGQLAAIT